MIHSNSSKLIPFYGQFLQILKTKFLVQTLISQRIMSLIKCFTDQNLSQLTQNRISFEFEKLTFIFHVMLR